MIDEERRHGLTKRQRREMRELYIKVNIGIILLLLLALAAARFVICKLF